MGCGSSFSLVLLVFSFFTIQVSLSLSLPLCGHCCLLLCLSLCLSLCLCLSLSLSLLVAHLSSFGSSFLCCFVLCFRGCEKEDSLATPSTNNTVNPSKSVWFLPHPVSHKNREKTCVFSVYWSIYIYIYI